MRERMKEPLVRFVVLGGALFGVHALVRGPAPEVDETPPIVISDAFVEGLRARHRVRAGTEAAEADLVRQHARDEALYREARRLGLDRGDAIVRRRLIQKMEMLLRASAPTPEPTDAALEAWLAAHADDYARPARFSFEHAWFARDRRGEAAMADARAALASGAIEGDPFLLGDRFAGRTRAQIAAQLGAAVADAVAEAPLEAWAGPVEGPLGVHLVRVTAREAPAAASLAEVRERVAADWARAREDERFEAAVGEVVDRYGVQRVEE